MVTHYYFMATISRNISAECSTSVPFYIIHFFLFAWLFFFILELFKESPEGNTGLYKLFNFTHL